MEKKEKPKSKKEKPKSKKEKPESKKEKPKSKKESLACSALVVEKELIFCPLYYMPVGIEAKVCKTCNWNDKKTEKKLYKDFMKKIKK